MTTWLERLEDAVEIAQAAFDNARQAMAQTPPEATYQAAVQNGATDAELAQYLAGLDMHAYALDPHAGGRSRAPPGPGHQITAGADLDGLDAELGGGGAAGWRASADSVRCPGRLNGVTGGMQIILYGRSSKRLNPTVRTRRKAVILPVRSLPVMQRVTAGVGSAL